MRKKRAVLAGGGTAGHVNPLLAVADRLHSENWDLQILGTEQGLESDLVPAAGFRLTHVPKVPLPRKPSKDLLSLPRRLRQAEKAAAAVIQGADVVIGFGGYVSVPAYRAAKKLGVPIVVHEQNVRPGLANRMAARYADVVCLTFGGTKLAARRGITEVTGLPLRWDIAKLAQERHTSTGAEAARLEAARSLGIRPDLTTLLITGGSLGAQHLNEAAIQAAGDLPATAQVIHLTGKGKDADVLESLPLDVRDRWLVLDYLPEMHRALAAADLVLCRSGAGTVAELTDLGLPAFYVPLPIGNGEQELNAAGHVASGGAVLMKDASFGASTVRQVIFPLLEDPEELERMSLATLAGSVGNGTGRVVEMVNKVARDDG